MAATGLRVAVITVAYGLLPTFVGGGVVLVGTLGVAGPGRASWRGWASSG